MGVNMVSGYVDGYEAICHRSIIVVLQLDVGAAKRAYNRWVKKNITK